MTTDWVGEARPVDPDLDVTDIEGRLSVLRNFTVADHLDDRSRELLIELARNVI